MSVPRKRHENLGVQISPTKSLASGVEQMCEAIKVMKLSKPHKRMQQAVTHVNVLSPVITIVMEADALHFSGRQHDFVHQWQGQGRSVGVLDNCMLQIGFRSRLGRSGTFLRTQAREVLQTRNKIQGCKYNVTEVGVARSSRSAGKPRTWQRGNGVGANEGTLGFPTTPRVT